MPVTHLVWDWNGTLLDDLTLVVDGDQRVAGAVGAGGHRRRASARLPPAGDRVLRGGRRAAGDRGGVRRLDARSTTRTASGCRTSALSRGVPELLAGCGSTQSLLSMWYHHELVPVVDRHELDAAPPPGRRPACDLVGGGSKAPHLRAHLAELEVDGGDVVLIGDSVDDAEAAAAVGARIVLYDGGITHVDKFRAVGFPVVDSLEDAVTLIRAL